MTRHHPPGRAHAFPRLRVMRRTSHCASLFLRTSVNPAKMTFRVKSYAQLCGRMGHALHMLVKPKRLVVDHGHGFKNTIAQQKPAVMGIKRQGSLNKLPVEPDDAQCTTSRKFRSMA